MILCSNFFSLNATFLAENFRYYGGGTRIAMELDEYRESPDIDLLCADHNGYRIIRCEISERSSGVLLANPRMRQNNKATSQA